MSLASCPVCGSSCGGACPYRLEDGVGEQVKPGSRGADLIAKERLRQIREEGWTPEHDDEFQSEGQLVRAALSYGQFYLDGLQPPDDWPWGPVWWKPGNGVRNLVKAGALIAAEIDRLLREKEK